MIHPIGQSFAHPRSFSFIWILLLLFSGDAWTQQGFNAPIGQGNTAPQKKTLKIREARFSVIEDKSVEKYERIAGSQRFLLKSVEKETRYEWTVGGRTVPGEGPAQGPQEIEGETSVNLLHHEGTLYAKIESVLPVSEGKRATEVRFSGTYEVVPQEGDWKSYEAGGRLKLTIAKADHERFITEIKQAYFGPESLTSQSQNFREKLRLELEAKANDPGDLPEQEAAMIKRVVELLKSRPEALAVTVVPSLTAKPVSFVIEGDEMIATTTDQVLSFLYLAELQL